jgi:integrase
MGLNIRKVGINEWRLDVRIRKAGQEIRRRETFRGTKTEASERYIALKRELREGKATQAPQKLKVFRDVLGLYFQRREALGGIDIARFKKLDTDLGDVPLNGFEERLDTYFKYLRKSPSPATGKPLSNASVNRHLAMIRTAFNLAVDLEYLERNPVTKARFPMLREVPRDRVLSEVEKLRLLNAIEKHAPHILALCRYALQVPCRRSELVNMRREDLDLVSNSIRVRNGTTKNDKGCDKPIPPDMVAYFRSLPSASPYLFYRIEAGQYLPLGGFYKSWQKCLKIAGITDFRLHDTRHMAATSLLDNGTPEQAVLTVAGWKTNMIRTYYHRDGKKSLNLVKFSPGSGHQVDSIAAVGT